jgi:sec-independent protein translocase protein TatA
MNFGSFEILALIMIFFILFGADRLPKLAKAMGESKGEFQKGLGEATNMDGSKTEQDLNAGGRTPEQALVSRAKKVGLDPSGMSVEELEKKVDLLEGADSDEGDIDSNDDSEDSAMNPPKSD